MRKILGHILLCFVFVLCFCFVTAAYPQGDDFDRALDKYDRICDRCLELRMWAESGRSVSMEELRGLFAELSSLRKTLSSASGKMSVTQVERFETIKDKYLQGMKSFEKSPSRPEFSPLSKIDPVTVPLEVKGAEMCKIVLRPAQPSDDLTLRAGVESLRLNDQRVRSSAEEYSKKLKFTIMAEAGIFPTPSCGAMASLTWNGFGAYVNYRSNYRNNEYSYTCSSDGVTEYGRIWATGDSRESRTVATAGFVLVPSQCFGFYAGAGLTSYMLCWEDSSGGWANVSDKSYKNFAVDAGLLVNVKSLIFSLGVTSDLSGHADLQFGVGVRF